MLPAALAGAAALRTRAQHLYLLLHVSSESILQRRSASPLLTAQLCPTVFGTKGSPQEPGGMLWEPGGDALGAGRDALGARGSHSPWAKLLRLLLLHILICQREL